MRLTTIQLLEAPLCLLIAYAAWAAAGLGVAIRFARGGLR